jgi:hypothetical protein
MPEDNRLIMMGLVISEMKKNSEREGLEKPGELFLATRMIDMHWMQWATRIDANNANSTFIHS